MRYLVNISFVGGGPNIVELVKTKVEAIDWMSMVDDSVGY